VHLHAFSEAFRSETFNARKLITGRDLDARVARWGATHLAHFVEVALLMLTSEQRALLAQRLRDHAAHRPSYWARKPLTARRCTWRSERGTRWPRPGGMTLARDYLHVHSNPPTPCRLAGPCGRCCMCLPEQPPSRQHSCVRNGSSSRWGRASTCPSPLSARGRVQQRRAHVRDQD
jgi:hypothetical protein